ASALPTAASSRANCSRYHANAPPAESTTPIMYQVSGITWQNVCARSPGSTCGSDIGASTVPDVPQLATASPGTTTPTPAAPHALSAPPPTTGVPSFNPVSPAAVVCTRPSTAADSPTSGRIDIGRPTARMISALHFRPAVLYISVADASDGSVAIAPVRRYR